MHKRVFIETFDGFHNYIRLRKLIATAIFYNVFTFFERVYSAYANNNIFN